MSNLPVSNRAVSTLRASLPSHIGLLPEYRWVTQRGEHLRPIVMETRHLYHTIAMLWHHTMPQDAHLYPHKRYELGARFTKDFITLSMRIMLAEILTRQDISPEWMRNLKRMLAYLQNHPKLGQPSVALDKPSMMREITNG